MIFSGGSGSLRPGHLRQADVVERILDDIGFDADRVTFEAEARNTFENAVYSYELIKPANDERWLLVTSAFHIARAVGCFRRAGWPVIAYPTDYRTSGKAGFNLPIKASQGLRSFDQAVHEWIGLVAYRLLGYTQSFFPAPNTS